MTCFRNSTNWPSITRLIKPSGNLSNMLQIRGELSAQPKVATDELHIDIMNVNLLHATRHEAPWIVVLKMQRSSFYIFASTASADVTDRAAMAV